MLRYHKCDGYWYYAVLGGLSGGSAFGPTYAYGPLWLCPSSTEAEDVSKVDGYIVDFPKNKLGDRECTHLYGEGDLAYVGSSNIIESIATLNNGDSFPLHTYCYDNKGKKKTGVIGGPVLVGSSLEFTKTFADRVDGSLSYRNIKCVVTTIRPHVISTTCTWQELLHGTVWIDKSRTTTMEVDPVNKRTRLCYDDGTPKGSWTPCLRLYYSVSGDSSKLVTQPRDWLKFSMRLKKLVSFDPMPAFGELAIKCADNAKSTDVNTVEYLRDLANFVSDGKAFWTLLKGKVSLKAISDLYLSLKYGYRLTYADTKTLASDLDFLAARKSEPYSVSRATSAHSTIGNGVQLLTRCYYKVYYDSHSSEFLENIADLQSLGIFPSPKTVWELIPFSFAVDWFTDMSNRINQLDAQLGWSTHTVFGTVMTTKSVYGPLTLDQLGLVGYVGTFTFHAYRRWTPKDVVLPQYFSDAPRSFNNHVDLAALVLQRKKK